MWQTNNTMLKMVEGDYGIDLPVTVNGVTFANEDTLVFTLKNAPNGDTLITKTFTDIADNTITLTLTEEESAELSVGTYFWVLDWYQSGAFLCNIIPCGLFRVVDKA